MAFSMHIVHLRINDAATGRPTPVRLRVQTPEGAYLPPLGRPQRIAAGWGEELGGSVCLAGREFAYIDGECELRLPSGRLEIEAAKGSEYEPLRRTIDLRPGQLAIRLDIRRQTQLEALGWYAGDCRAHLLSPHAACLEGAAEGLHLVNLLAASWKRGGRRLLANLTEFSGQTPALDRHGCQVAVNTFNQGGGAGDLALLNCHRLVFPLRLDDEGFEAWTIADWCHQCHRRAGLERGLVVWAGFQAAHAAAIRGLEADAIDAVEATDLARFDGDGGEEWYALLNAGRRLPLVGSSGKVSNATAVGAVRTYARLEEGQAFEYRAWIDAVRRGRTLVTAGPLLRFLAAGAGPGDRIPPAHRIPVQIECWAAGAEDQLELILDGGTVASWPAADRVETELAIPSTGRHWLAARLRRGGILTAHTSPAWLIAS